VKNKIVSIVRAEVRFERKPDRSATSETEDEPATTKVQVVDLPARVYSMLTFLIVISAALLVLTFVRPDPHPVASVIFSAVDHFVFGNCLRAPLDG
jgi:hypothetical protein